MGELDFMKLAGSSSKDIENISPIKMEDTMNKNIRDAELIQQIKDAGQELIDRAESMVGEHCDYITDFDIWISLNPADNPTPEISWTVKVACKETMKRLFSK